MRAHASKTCEHRRHPGQSADRLWPRGASDGFGLDRTSSRSRDLMAFRDQRGNQFTPNGAGRASNKDALHRPQVVGSGGISSTIKRATACAIALSVFQRCFRSALVIGTRIAHSWLRRPDCVAAGFTSPLSQVTALLSLGERTLCRRRQHLQLQRHVYKLPGSSLQSRNLSRDFENEIDQTKDKDKSAREKINHLPQTAIARLN